VHPARTDGWAGERVDKAMAGQFTLAAIGIAGSCPMAVAPTRAGVLER